MNGTCGCCEGLEPLTPLATANRPGLSALTYRAGTHATFLATMKAGLSAFPALSRLTVREDDDWAIAMLDAWATVSDVLTFYQERIANECYLRTATERRSILELARLVGYTLRPGVAASVYIVLTLEEGYDLEIPAGGVRAQSLPGPEETPQPFETAEELEARAAWNDLEPRMTKPQWHTLSNAYGIDTLYFEGVATNLAPNAPLLLVFGDGIGQQALRRVKSVEPQVDEDRTKVELQVGADSADFVCVIQQTLDKYLDRERFGIRRGGRMADDVSGILEELRDSRERSESPERLATLARDSLPQLREYRDLAEDNDWRRLVPYLRGLVKELERAVSMMPPRGTNVVPRALAASSAQESWTENNGTPASVSSLAQLLAPLSKPPAPQLAGAFRLERNLDQVLAPGTDATPQLLIALNPALGPELYTAWKNAAVVPPSSVQYDSDSVEDPPLREVYALRVTASLFGHNAPKKPFRCDPETGRIEETGDWPIIEDVTHNNHTRRIKHEEEDTVHLDFSYDEILPESWLVVRTPHTRLTDECVFYAKAKNPNAAISRAEYGVTGESTRIGLVLPDLSESQNWIAVDLDDPDLSPSSPGDDDFEAVRRTVVFAQSEALTLAEEPISEPVCGARIELGTLYDGLKPGRWLIISGERTDIKDLTGGTVGGVRASELVVLASVTQGVHQISTGANGTIDLPGDRPHSTLILANGGLTYCYKLDTVTIYGNVVRATHGETRTEVLGSGDASKALQQFSLRQSPLTYVAAPTPTGTESTLKVSVDDVRWPEARSLAELQPNDRRFVTRTDDQDRTTLVFGDGQRGARLPTGVENVEAVYRTGIGQAGNVQAEQISQLATRPLGLQGVINPRRATGGADRETYDQARRNAPLAVTALDRLVSVQDYEDFARTFAGIGKASAARLSGGRRQLVHLTIAGANDIPIAEDSDLYRSLVQALQQFGAPHQPLRVEVRELILLAIEAGVRVLADYRWESVEPEIRKRLLDTFGFERRELGQDALLSEAISAIQQVRGVAYIDVNIFSGISEEVAKATDGQEITQSIKNLVQGEDQPLQRVSSELARSYGGRIRPAQLAFLMPDLQDTLILLKEITI